MLIHRLRLLGGLALITMIGNLGCQKAPPGLTPPEPPPVSVDYPVEKELASYFEFIGQLKAVKDQEVRAQVGGYLKKIYFQEGQKVKAGEALYEIDPIPYQATLDKAKGHVLQVKASLKRAQLEEARVQGLFKTKAVSEEERDRAVANLASAEGELAIANAEVTQAEFDLKNTVIRTETTGLVGRTEITEGNLVTAGTTLLTRVTSVSPIYGFWDVDELTSLWYRERIYNTKTIPNPRTAQQLKCWIRLNSPELPERAGVVDYIDPIIDRDTGTRPIRGVFDNDDGFLTPGDSVRVRVEAGPARRRLLITELAIGSQQTQKFVYVVNPADEVEQRKVTLGEVRDGMQEILSGITANDRVIVNGLLRVRPGMKVNPKLVSSK
ncbi:efflux RND transporter periplasmic adaptor subunit [Tuwongella immobilis]|uniref:Uncharacterized protein n=1 Tax=Tuwongella immobilis TaxID=692036 RepID=A0A6C2YPZ9_9BACT|nr:efflux RND transporter periplasmic adaptor subunit [Tuwongella immobilis]VIP03391.1 rnd transporter : RND efflux transporter, MFP subunit OS=Methylomicrobium alcaliphilum (strain DSM 19304 / NCIMB 14124 / VKM B-2133 / 20Z) GN=MEALZ_2147 PE=4 SV=1: HlyD_2 [Tuwongella immobilis]VTS04154.1 rnd transporter : RND efflux transporter, MFP subunit OS=Methylomicrobium alcaliphilum (strain DSM 19304 / NCIMB 14124 / VKM B-2133 / 20Z) GN=MEALZ_2147 PE=4 SV=1: HlyD_2 [Tuwongella immobilis]